MHNNITLSDIEELFKKYRCDCVEVEVVDIQDYIDMKSPVIPDALKKVKFTF